MPRSFLVLHGWENHRPPEHWQHHLVRELRRHGEQAVYPQLPDADAPDVDVWIEAVTAEWDLLPDGERVVVAHSLGVPTWIHACARHGLTADRVLLVAPTGPSAHAAHPAIAAWAPLPAGLDGSSWHVVCSDDDPYCPEGAAEWFGTRYGCEATVVPGAGHFSIDDGYGPWPWILEQCLRQPGAALAGDDG